MWVSRTSYSVLCCRPAASSTVSSTRPEMTKNMSEPESPCTLLSTQFRADARMHACSTSHSPLGTLSRTPSSLTRLTCDCGSAHTSSKPRTSRPPDRESVPPWRPPSLSSAPAARHCAHQHHRPWRRPAVLSTGIISNGSVPWCPCRVAAPAPRPVPGTCTPVNGHTCRDRQSEPIHDEECDALQTTRHNAHELVEGLGMVFNGAFECRQRYASDNGSRSTSDGSNDDFPVWLALCEEHQPGNNNTRLVPVTAFTICKRLKRHCPGLSVARTWPEVLSSTCC